MIGVRSIELELKPGKTASQNKLKSSIFYIFHIGGTVIISAEDKLNICEIGTYATLKWNFFGIRDSISVHKIFYYKNNTKYELFREIIFDNTMNRYLHPDLESLFDRNRVAGFIHFVNGNGTLTVNITNVRYDDSGVFGYEGDSFYGSNSELFSNITLDVQSEISML